MESTKTKRFNIDLKSLVIGLLSGALVLSMIGADGSTTQPAGGMTTVIGPRYEISAYSQGTDRIGAFMVDTQTGEVLSILGRTTIGGGNKMFGNYTVERVQR